MVFWQHQETRHNETYGNIKKLNFTDLWRWLGFIYGETTWLQSKILSLLKINWWFPAVNMLTVTENCINVKFQKHLNPLKKKKKTFLVLKKTFGTEIWFFLFWKSLWSLIHENFTVKNWRTRPLWTRILQNKSTGKPLCLRAWTSISHPFRSLVFQFWIRDFWLGGNWSQRCSEQFYKT